MRKSLSLRNGLTGVSPVTSGKRTSGVVLSGSHEHATLPTGHYATIDDVDLAEILSAQKVSGDGWQVFLSGALPIMAVKDDGTTIRSLHRLKAWDCTGHPRTPEERSAAAEGAAMVWFAAQERAGIKPGTGLSASVQQLCPEVKRIRRHAGQDILYRDVLLRGGRNEVFKRKATTTVSQWDMRSAYAGAYKDGIPGEFIRRSRSVGSGIFFAHVTVRIDAKEYVPLAPFRSPGGALLFPTGTFDIWLASPEFHALDRRGHILRVHEAHHYTEVNPFAGFVDSIYSLRLSARSAIERNLYKTLLVSAYGMLATPSTFPGWKVRPKEPPKDGLMISPGFFQTVSKPRWSSAHVPAAAYITSKIRARLGEALSFGTPYYCAVDSVTLSGDDAMPCGENPGDFQLVGHFDGGEWHTSGVYTLGNGAVAKASGIDSAHRDSYLAGETVTVERFASAKSLLEKGHRVSALISLKMREERIDKRPFLDNGDTRAPTIEEAMKV